jgi:hypothetical protein
VKAIVENALARGREWIDALSIDTRLGLRMLVKCRGLTVIGGFAMAVAVGIGATMFEALGEVLTQALPLEHVNASSRCITRPPTQRTGTSAVRHNLASPDAPPEPVDLAEMTASG